MDAFSIPPELQQFLENLYESLKQQREPSKQERAKTGGQEAVEIGLHEAIKELDFLEEIREDGELNQIIIISDAGANSRQSMTTM